MSSSVLFIFKLLSCKKFIYLFNFCLCWDFIAGHRLSPVVASWGYSLVAGCRWLLMELGL